MGTKFWAIWYGIMGIGIIVFIGIVMPMLIKLELRYLDWINNVMGCK